MSKPLRVLFQDFYHDDHCDALEWLCSGATFTPLLWLEHGKARQLRMVAVLAYWTVAYGTVWPLLCTRNPAVVYGELTSCAVASNHVEEYL